jgi:glutamate-1-semialdehyde 2,1-aminomutase/spore coat polysaccharide biosynthesis protein SpsF
MIAAIIQARMSSSRFPGKTLTDIAGEPMLGHVVRRARSIPAVQEVIIATTHNPADTAILEFAEESGLCLHLGSENDVLDRFYETAKRFEVTVIVRVTPDCPLLDPEVSSRVLDKFLKSKGTLDYACNTEPRTFPDGLDTEVFSFAALERTWCESELPSEREHVTPYIWKNPGMFRIGNVCQERDLSLMRWTVDEPYDLEFVRAIYERLAPKRIFGMSDVLEVLEREPQLIDVNKEKIRNEGYYKSLARETPLPLQRRKLDRSHELKRAAERLIPSCTQTFSKGPTQFVQGVAPTFLIRGQGSHVWDVDGNEYIDYPMALGPIILGHNYPAVTEAAIRQIRDGTTFSLPHPLEVEVAELLVEVIPCAEMVRFAKNGSDATSGAVRLARAYTTRDIIACCGYHGWQDWYIGTTTRSKGVPKAVQELTVSFEYNNIESLKRIFVKHPGQVAAVIMEPFGLEEPEDGFLQALRDLTREEGALLIYDEILTGFRLALGGAQEYFGVTPDLACFGKAMGNGYPIAAVVGPSEIMRLFDEVFFSFTFGGEAVSLAAAIATINEMRQKDVVGRLWEQGQKLKDGYKVFAREFGVERFTDCIGLAPRTVITFRDETGAELLVLKSLFQQECLKRGVLFSANQNICYSHSNADVDHTLRTYRTAMEILAEAIKSGDALQKLEGQAVQPVFRISRSY